MARTSLQPLATADAWRGSELARNATWRCQLDSRDRRELAEAVRHARASGRLAWRRDDFPLPALGKGIREWPRELEHGRAWYIRESQLDPRAPRLTDAQRECVALLEAIANEAELWLDMQFRPGDLQLLRNASVLHKRTAYEDWPDPARRRHLLRLWLARAEFSAGDARLRRGIRAREFR